ncbi:putative disease resistance protein RGA3 isoform X1 [Arachis hypogaea]|uniref:putative disease resistance protein RGA3 isoform X1 n=2 Tax=Arachis hypogaea TaxID=3818 RepID=UPI003B21A8B5
MAEQIPYGVAASLINKIASLAFREIGRIYGVMDDLEKLKDTLESIKVVLSDAELKQGQNATVAHWIKRFKQVLYDADDLLDDVFIKDLRRKRMSQMLESLKKDAGGDSLEALQQKLREELNGQNYMLVLDDVWNEDHSKWSDLRTHLMCGGQGSKLLVTTRSTLVSKAMGIDEPYVLRGLTDEQSWTLLKNLTFGEDSSRMNSELQAIGKEIAKKCKGVPLAIKTIGGFLRIRVEEIDQWSTLLHGDIWRLCEEENSIMPVLNLSYRNLRPELRQCFAYCCLYPKDSVIRKNECIQLWMAQGYLASLTGTQSMEDVGNNYVKILLMRSFFQDASMDENGHIRSFKMHDLMHDLATSVAGNDCYLHTEGKGIVGRPMHVAFETSTICSLDVFDVCKLRTIIHCKIATNLVAKLSFMEKLKCLRALDLSFHSLTQLPMSIDKVKHLRYLDLSYTELRSLPESIGNLICLQTLKLGHCESLVSLPESVGNLICLESLKLNDCKQLVFPTKIIIKLINLKKLDIEGCKAFEDGMPVGLGKLISLQSLSSFVVGNDKKDTSGKLNELKELDLRGRLIISELGLVKDAASESHETNMRSKKHIQDLSLLWGPSSDSSEYEIRKSESLVLLDNLCPHQNLRSLHLEGFPGVRLSDWLISLIHVVRISLHDLPNCKHLPPLERLPCLRELEVADMRSLEWMDYYENIGDVFFSSLEQLDFHYCENLRGWQMLGDETQNHLSLPPFPRLSYLQIVGCPNLTCMPSFPHLVRKLELRWSSSVKPMLETCMVKHESSSISPLSHLKLLLLWGVTGIEAMAEDWMKSLTSLKSLHLRGSSAIQILSRHLQYLPSQLKNLAISFDDDKLDLWKDTQGRGPPHALSSLQTIFFFDCKNMKALPEQIGNLQSLTLLEIMNCPKLESLDEADRRLTNIHTVGISGCPFLEHKYRAESEDRAKIAHIPHISIY